MLLKLDIRIMEIVFNLNGELKIQIQTLALKLEIFQKLQ